MAFLMCGYKSQYPERKRGILIELVAQKLSDTMLLSKPPKQEFRFDIEKFAFLRCVEFTYPECLEIDLCEWKFGRKVISA